MFQAYALGSICDMSAALVNVCSWVISRHSIVALESVP